MKTIIVMIKNCSNNVSYISNIPVNQDSDNVLLYISSIYLKKNLSILGDIIRKSYIDNSTTLI